jgi:hypothetical protein
MDQIMINDLIHELGKAIRNNPTLSFKKLLIEVEEFSFSSRFSCKKRKENATELLYSDLLFALKKYNNVKLKVKHD